MSIFSAQWRLVALIHVKFGRAEGYVGTLSPQNFTTIDSRRWERGPPQITFFGTMAKPFDGFLRLLRAFISPSTLHQCFTFAAIRFTGYGVISEKPHVGHLPRIFPCTL